MQYLVALFKTKNRLSQPQPAEIANLATMAFESATSLLGHDIALADFMYFTKVIVVQYSGFLFSYIRPLIELSVSIG